MSVNVAGIRENGKTRIVTSGSFYKDQLLQPFSHITIEMAKSLDELTSSFQAARLGYDFVRDITSDRISPMQELFKPNKTVLIRSTDWKKATDRPPHAQGRMIMGKVFSHMGLNDALIRDLLDAWASEKYLFVNGKEVGVMVNGLPMGDPLTKTNLSLAHPISVRYAKKKFLAKYTKSIFVYCRGNGDDEVAVVAADTDEEARYFFQCLEEASSMLGYEKSEEDTFITDDWATYCEEIFRVPVHRFDTIKHAVRYKDSTLSPYLDLPKIRLMIDTRKDRQDFSSDPRGKVTLLGTDCEYVLKDSTVAVNNLFSVSAALQDIGLGLRYASIPYYLPKQIWGVGRVVPFWNETSWARAMNSQDRRVRNLTLRALEEYNTGKHVITAVRAGISRQQTHFDTESYLEVFTIPEDDPIKQYCVVRTEDWEKFPSGVLEKLLSGNRLISEHEINKFYLFHQRLESLTQDLHQDLFEVIGRMGVEIEDYDDARQSKIISDFSKEYKGNTFCLTNAVKQNLYPESLRQKLGEFDPRRVIFDWPYLANWKRTRSKGNTPMSEDLDTLEDWFKWNFEAVKAGEFYEDVPTYVISDDEVILEEIDRYSVKVHVIVSDDRKLIRKAQNIFSPHKLILGFSARTYQLSTWEGEPHNLEDYNFGSDDEYGMSSTYQRGPEMTDVGCVHPRVFSSVFEKIYGMQPHVHLDIGSIDEAQVRMEPTREAIPGWNQNVNRDKRIALPLREKHTPNLKMDNDLFVQAVEFPRSIRGGFQDKLRVIRQYY
jgi:hypothetical protein